MRRVCVNDAWLLIDCPLLRMFSQGSAVMHARLSVAIKLCENKSFFVHIEAVSIAIMLQNNLTFILVTA